MSVSRMLNDYFDYFSEDIPISKCVFYLTGAIATLSFTYVTIRAIQKRRRRLQREKYRPEHPNNTVILHQFGRGKDLPSSFPFSLKLETYFRMAKIPYMNVHLPGMSPKGKTPWIEFNGETISDSSFIVEFLNKRYEVDLNKNLTSEEKATAIAFQSLIEDSLYWVGFYIRWVENDAAAMKEFFGNSWKSWIMLKVIMYRHKKMLHSQGYGRHTHEEIYNIGTRDLKAFSDFLGEKKYLFGDEPCEQDCAMFGLLAQIIWPPIPIPAIENRIPDEYRNIVRYCEGIKEVFWPDWNDCVIGKNRFFTAPEADTKTLEKLY